MRQEAFLLMSHVLLNTDTARRKLKSADIGFGRRGGGRGACC